MSQFAPEANLDADDQPVAAKCWRRVRAAVTFVAPNARRFQAIAFELIDLAPEFPRMEAAMKAWMETTGAQVVDVEFEQSEDLAPAREAFGPGRPLH
jgi:uncharacterized protein Usg